jgi:2-polyprenyl-3-methyl-5-hydroxy-6-metoxy-1,4-benzoquinol methylase
MNRPVPESEHNKYGTMIELGSIEHVFDTAACIENCLRMVRKKGHYLLHTEVNGYFGDRNRPARGSRRAGPAVTGTASAAPAPPER